MKVRAKVRCFDGLAVREIGEVFEFKGEKLPKWMKKVTKAEEKELEEIDSTGPVEGPVSE